MASLFDRFRGRKEPTSAEIAKERLKLVLVTDRSNLSPEKLEEMQREIILVIKRYIPINEMDVQINIEQRERKHYLVADVPLSRSADYGALESPEDTPEFASGSAAVGNPSDDEEADEAEQSDLPPAGDAGKPAAAVDADDAAPETAADDDRARDTVDADDHAVADAADDGDAVPAARQRPRRKRSS